MKEWLILFLQLLGVLFAGIVLCNVVTVLINCISNGFARFLPQIIQLPYLLYFIFSLILSLVLTLIVWCKRK